MEISVFLSKCVTKLLKKCIVRINFFFKNTFTIQCLHECCAMYGKTSPLTFLHEGKHICVSCALVHIFLQSLLAVATIHNYLAEVWHW